MQTRELLFNVPLWAEVAMYVGAAVAIVMLTTDLRLNKEIMADANYKDLRCPLHTTIFGRK